MNHKQAIEYLVLDPAHAQLSPDVIIALHAFLSDGLMADPQAVGRIRRRAVEIGGSVYLPVALPQRLETGDDTRGWGGAAVFAGCTGQRHGRGGVLPGHEPQQALGGLRYFYPCGAANDSRFAAALHCDVFVENFKVGDMARYGLDYASLCKIKPSLVYCSITGFGQTGPYKDRAGYDYAVRGIGGLVSITGERDGMQGHGMQGQLSRFPKATTTAQ